MNVTKYQEILVSNSAKINALCQVFPFQAQYVTARVFTADGYDYGFLKGQ
jgi:hypothetical protein